MNGKLHLGHTFTLTKVRKTKPSRIFQYYRRNHDHEPVDHRPPHPQPSSTTVPQHKGIVPLGVRHTSGFFREGERKSDCEGVKLYHPLHLARFSLSSCVQACSLQAMIPCKGTCNNPCCAVVYFNFKHSPHPSLSVRVCGRLPTDEGEEVLVAVWISLHGNADQGIRRQT